MRRGKFKKEKKKRKKQRRGVQEKLDSRELIWKRRHESGSGLKLEHDVTMFFTLQYQREEGT